MDMMQIGSLILLVGMFIFILPRTISAVKNSPKGTANDWFNVGAVLLVVIGFVLILTQMV